MKRCPQCGREYDLSMSFCLDDGEQLLYGPGAGSGAHDEPATAILSEPGAIATGSARVEDRTRIYKSDLQADLHNSSKTQRTSANRAAKPLMITAVVMIILVGGFLGYRYYAASGKSINSIAVMPFTNE